MQKNINERFNKELLWQIEGRLPKGHIYKLGMPSEALLSAGIENLAIEIAASILTIKSSTEYKSNHPFNLSDVINLPKAMQGPIAIFESEDLNGRKVILTELTDKKGSNFIAILDVQKKKGRNYVEVNDIVSLYAKNSGIRIAKWFDSKNPNGLNLDVELLKWADTKKALSWLANYSSDVNRVGLSSKRIAKIIENFENPKYTQKKEIKKVSSQGYKL